MKTFAKKTEPMFKKNVCLITFFEVQMMTINHAHNCHVSTQHNKQIFETNIRFKSSHWFHNCAPLQFSKVMLSWCACSKYINLILYKILHSFTLMLQIMVQKDQEDQDWHQEVPLQFHNHCMKYPKRWNQPIRMCKIYSRYKTKTHNFFLFNW